MNRQPAESATPVARLRGMSDLTGPSLLKRVSLERYLSSLLASYGYRSIDTPLLEPTELFLRKSGGELASQLFSFTDPGSRAVSLRPEFTAPAMRHYLENAGQIDLPARWQYCGSVFRFDGAALASPKDAQMGGQFTQIGGELLGSSSVMADVELIELASSVLSESGLTGWTLRLADLDILNSLLDPLGLSERARAFVVQSVPQLSEGPSAIQGLMDKARRLHFIGRPTDDDYLSQAVNGLDDAEAKNVLLGVLRSNPLDQLGQRKPEEVVERLLRKIRRPDAEQTFRQALQAACRLAQVHGNPSDALEEAASLLRKAGADSSSTERMRKILTLLPERTETGGHVVLDLGLVRGLAYYNGIIFEVSHPNWPGPLGGGGRYDGLARDLGGTSRVPALGFAYNLDALVALTIDSLRQAQEEPDCVLVLPQNESAQPAALRVARELRSGGIQVETEMSGRTVEEVRADASQRGYARFAIVEETGNFEMLDI